MSATVGFPAPQEHRAEQDRMIADALASRLAARDTALWGPAASRLAGSRLGWTDLHTRSAGLVEQIAALREELAAEGIDRIVLAGMGGSSLGAEVIAAAHGVELTILDSTDPLSVRAVVGADSLDRSALVVSTKSGGTIETISAASAFAQALRARGIEPAGRLIAVTDPGTTLAEQALEEGWRRVFLADPDVGGRFSVLGAFGLVPAGLAGADVEQVVSEAAAVAEALHADNAENPAVVLASALSAAHARSIRLLAVAATDPALAALPAWLEQLIAESTGKDGAGVLPIACEDVEAPGFTDADAGTGVCFLGEPVGEHQPVSGVAVSCAAPLGAQFLIWETATALLCAGLGVDPFDQPDVESAKIRAREILASAPQAAGEQDGQDQTESLAEADAADDGSAGGNAEDAHSADGAGQEPEAPFLVDGAVELYASPHLIDDLELHERTLPGLLDAVLPERDDERYLAVCAFLSSICDPEAARLRPLLAERAEGAAVSFGWGPRYLHSTGQLHKGGPDSGSYLFVTAETPPEEDMAVPGAGFGFARLIAAQAAGDAAVLEGLGRRVLRVHLREREAGLARLFAAITGSEGAGGEDSPEDSSLEREPGEDSAENEPGVGPAQQPAV